MAVKPGIHPQYFSILDRRYDLFVEAEVAAVTGILTEAPAMLDAASFRVQHNVPAGADSAQESAVRIYRLENHPWTQVLCPSSANKPFELGKYLSGCLSTRCLQIEVTGDAWGGHALFDRGMLKEISCFCTGVDLPRLCSRFGLTAPEVDDDQLYEEIELFHSELALNRESDKLRELVEHLGLWVDAGDPVWDGDQEVDQLDLLFAS